MSAISSQTEARLRQAFKRFNRFMLLIWRLGLGRWVNVWPAVGGRIMVINHTGRKTGQPRHTPVNYAEVGGELYCTAGFGAASDWYRNILANPVVDVWLADGWWTGTATDVSDSPQRLPLLRQVLIGSGLVAPALGIDPARLSDQELAAVTESYRLIHIRREAARTGPGGPADLAWVWPLSTGLLFILLLRRRR